MFHQFAKMADAGVSITMTVARASDGRLAVSVLPKTAKGKDDKDKSDALTLTPFTVTGTPDELNAGFVRELKGVSKAVTGLITNAAEFAALVKKENAAVAKKAEASVKSKKTAKAAPAPAKKEPAASSQQNIFEDI